jgi:hypothetical protein
MPPTTPCPERADLSYAALSRHFVGVAEMADAQCDWKMAEMFIALAYLYAGVRYDDELPVETRLTIGNEMGGDFARKEFGIDIHGVL